MMPVLCTLCSRGIAYEKVKKIKRRNDKPLLEFNFFHFLGNQTFQNFGITYTHKYHIFQGLITTKVFGYLFVTWTLIPASFNACAQLSHNMYTHCPSVSPSVSLLINDKNMIRHGCEWMFPCLASQLWHGAHHQEGFSRQVVLW